MSKSKWNLGIKDFLLIALSTLTGIIICEIALFSMDKIGVMPDVFRKINADQYNFSPETAQGLYFSHPFNSYELVPSYEHNGWAHINSLGFRGEEFEKIRKPDTYRIVALGDSTTYGIWNQYDKTYPFQLEKLLRERLTYDKIEVINAGLVSATTAEALIRFYFKVLDLKPDMLVFYSGLSDIIPRIFNNFRDDYSHFRKNPHREFSIRTISYLARLVGYVFETHGHGLVNVSLADHTWRLENLPTTDRKRIENFKSTNSRAFERNLQQLLLAAKANNIKVALATFAYNPKLRKWTPAVPEELWGIGISEHNAVITRLAEKNNVPLCRFAEIASDNVDFFGGEAIHLSDYGNGKLAECFADSMEIEIKSKLSRLARWPHPGVGNPW